ncbi:putative sugar kinase [Desulforamulus hydrothermalis Lam5 = DSM 18033]|uniref:Putative sugar kinase n=1 Tax=Desulforamulus hydrothermalis Lam5 = DSM 18033 TaxID=1121428 RepID=K8E086_9FIRM|nr:putative sugar kinase [Desulforamulus hydrothermalis Lam5 = DSM 18033]SHG72781.1 fructokinase [Desulforamulus hydrothermalis Lam5 = DSM 18033]
MADTPAFEKRPGGAPANVAVGIARLGGSSGFIGKFADDEFGRFLLKTLEENQVDTQAVVITQEAPTGLAFVTLKDNGEREFIFYRRPCADILLTADEIAVSYIEQAKVLHFGTVSLITEPGRSATYHAVRQARQAGKIISLDVNLREALWPSLAAARQEIRTALRLAHIVKVSGEELAFITENNESLEEAAKQILELGSDLVLVTLGAAGCYVQTKHLATAVKSIAVHSVDTTGAGDAFTAAVLTRLVEAGLHDPGRIHNISLSTLEEICTFANIAGALTCTRKGAIPALPTRKEIAERMGLAE